MHKLYPFILLLLLGLGACEHHEDPGEFVASDTLFADGTDSLQLLYCSFFSADDLPGWTNCQLWTQDKGGARLCVGPASYLRNYYSLNKRVCCVVFVPETTSRFSVGIDNEQDVYGSRFWLAVVDAGAQTVCFGDSVKPMALQSTHTYAMLLSTSDNNTSLQVTDLDSSGNRVEFASLTTEAQDFYGLRVLGGESPLFRQFQVMADRKPWVVFLGNSITFGSGSPFVDGHPVHAFAHLAGEATGRTFLVSGRGGNTVTELLETNTYKGRVESELKLLRPRYAVITIGTNGGNTFQNLNELLGRVRNLGVEPILNNIPCMSSLNNGLWIDADDSANKLIDSVRSVTGVNGARFNMATSTGDGVTLNKSVYTIENGTYRIHPNKTGHRLLFEQLLEDCPELFE